MVLRPETKRVDVFDWAQQGCPPVIVSLGYRHKIGMDLQGSARCYNVHISMLPWNRGASPNLWAWLDGTPHGVTIHRVDDGLDTGPIVHQVQMTWDADDLSEATLRSTYDDLMIVAEAFLDASLEELIAGPAEERPQPPGGSFHTRAESDRLLSLLPMGYDTPVSGLGEWLSTQPVGPANESSR